VHTVTIEGVEPPLVFTSTYEYDVDNRLIAVESPLLVAEYKYDGLGNLLQLNEAGTIRRLVRDRADGLARPLLETDASGNPTRSWLWANGSLIAQVETGTVRYAHFNELGHLVALTDESGTVTDEFAYHPYGRLVARTGPTRTPFAYMGAHGVMRAGHDLYLTRHRAYSANLMRFLQTDPSGLEGGLNLYAYGAGNPVFFVDILGLHITESSYSMAQSALSKVTAITSASELASRQQAANFNRALGANSSSPQLAQHVATDLLLALPIAVTTEAALQGGARGLQWLRGAAKSEGAVFWSGRAGANRAAAEAFAGQSGRTTLEMSSAGRALEQQGVTFAQNPEAWINASRGFAAQASGEVNAFAGGARANSIWKTVELPTLMQNNSVTKIIIQDATRPEVTRIIYPPRVR
jgi:RHS repeat-associated protein